VVGADDDVVAVVAVEVAGVGDPDPAVVAGLGPVDADVGGRQQVQVGRILRERGGGQAGARYKGERHRCDCAGHAHGNRR